MSVASSAYVPASVTRRALVAWSAYALVAWIIALAALARWLWAVTLDGPVIYGEGAVAHAAILARDRLEYTVGARFGDVPPLFTAANYPPLYFHLAGLGDPFLVGRAISIVATVAVAAAIGWRARTGGALVAGALAAAWLASFPVAVWGAAVKPDLVALALTVGAVLALSAPRLADGPLVAGALLGLAVTAKPTAGLPALALAVAIVMRGDPLGFLRYVAAGVGAALAVGFATRLPDKAMYLHVVDWNALAWTPEQAVLLVLVAILTIGVPVLFALVLRAGPGPSRPPRRARWRRSRLASARARSFRPSRRYSSSWRSCSSIRSGSFPAGRRARGHGAIPGVSRSCARCRAGSLSSRTRDCSSRPDASPRSTTSSCGRGSRSAVASSSRPSASSARSATVGSWSS
ncbi:MAG: hypothetical protein E6H94_06545 [Chloroflexi bacterium]|nr:MAG: hypothetical protein E6H94_06545 [Chloroflexota bacterium]